jgi:hypothetical protein
MNLIKNAMDEIDDIYCSKQTSSKVPLSVFHIKENLKRKRKSEKQYYHEEVSLKKNND